MKYIKEEDFPTKAEMTKDLKAAGFTGDSIMKAQVKGHVFNRNRMEVTIKREWAKLNDIDAIIPFKDKHEAEQLVILTDKIKLGKPMLLTDFYGIK
jgi:hypothetical protein